jgi:cell division septation protein DedD
MKKTGIGYFVSAFCFFASAAGASTADSLYSLAQKLYSQGVFTEASVVYSSLCPQLEAREKSSCLFKEIKSLAGIKTTGAAQAAQEKLLPLLSQTEPGDSLFAELNAEAAKLQIMLKQPAMAARSWNAAHASANSDYFPELFVLCQDIVSAFPEASLTNETCNTVKPRDTSLVSLPRNKIVPLGKAPPGKEAKAPPSQAANKWCVQLGAFGARENAEKLVATFKQKGVQLYITELPERKLFAVRTGNFATSEDAKTYAEQKIKPSHEGYKVISL